MKKLLVLFLLAMIGCGPKSLNHMSPPVVVVGSSPYSITVVDADNQYETISSEYFLFHSLKGNYKKGDTLLYFKK